MKKGTFFFFVDTLIVIISFYFFLFLRFNRFPEFSNIKRSVIYFLVLWLVISLVTKKYKISRLVSFNDVLTSVAFSNLVILGFTVIFIKVWQPFIDYRFIFIYSIILSTVFELGFLYLVSIFQKAAESTFFPDETVNYDTISNTRKTKANDKLIPQPAIETEQIVEPDSFIDLNSIIIEETDIDTLNFIRKYFSPRINDTLILSTTTVFNLYTLPRPKYEVIINLKRINDVQYINKFFEAINAKLVTGGLVIDWVETYSQRKKRILSKYPWGLNYIIYTLDFLIKRVFPKLNFTKKLYFLLTRGQNRVISKAETFGRLYSCGFEIVEEQFINDRLFFVFRKVKDPLFDYHPTYGPIIKLQRIGKGGKIIGVFKFRTMHAYSEYLQDYIYQNNDLEEGGKFKNDFRITTLGRIFRAFWIDELPMLINVFILRNMKLVGVRPLSQHYFNLYSEELQKRRIINKPGLIPPYYAQFPPPKSLIEIQENEARYLEQYEKHPVITDIKYFFVALYNIIIKKARSR